MLAISWIVAAWVAAAPGAAAKAPPKGAGSASASASAASAGTGSTANSGAKVKTFRFEGLDVQGEVGRARALHFMDPRTAETPPARAPRRSFRARIGESRAAEEL